MTTPSPLDLLRRFLSGVPPGVRFMAASAFAFSLMSVCVKMASARLPSQEIVLARAAISLVLSWALLRRAGQAVWGRRRRMLVLRGVLGFCGLSCFYYAITRLPLAQVTVLHYTQPVFTALLAWMLLGERVGRGLLAAIVLCFTGVVLIAKPDFLFAGGGSGLDPFATLVALGGAVFSAAAYTTVRGLSRDEHPLVIVFYFPLVAVPLSIPPMIDVALWPRGMEWVWLLAVGIFTQIGQVTLTRGLRAETAGRAMSVGYLQVLFAAVWGAVFFTERPDAWAVAGAGLILAGTVVISHGRAPGGDAARRAA